MKKFRVSCDSCSASVIDNRAVHEAGCLTGLLTFKANGKTYGRWKVWALDVWGNERDGFEVNDRSCLGSVMIPENATDATIIKALKKRGWIGANKRFGSFTIDGGDGRTGYINWRKNDEPLFELERE